MSFGFSVGDFLAIGRLVLNLYNACKDAPGEFREINAELSSLHIVICDLAEQARDPTSLLLRRGGDREPEWREIRLNLEATLGELQDLVNRYQTMGKSAWRRVRLASENLSELRVKLTFHLGAINVFLDSLALSALGRIEPVLGRIETLLREYVREEQAGQRAATVLTAHETNDESSWRQVEMDLLTEGISRDDFDKHKHRIRELLIWVIQDEVCLSQLQEVGPNDSVSCFTKPISTALSTVEEIFSPSSIAEAELTVLHDGGEEVSRPFLRLDEGIEKITFIASDNIASKPTSITQGEPRKSKEIAGPYHSTSLSIQPLFAEHQQNLRSNQNPTLRPESEISDERGESGECLKSPEILQSSKEPTSPALETLITGSSAVGSLGNSENDVRTSLDADIDEGECRPLSRPEIPTTRAIPEFMTETQWFDDQVMQIFGVPTIHDDLETDTHQMSEDLRYSSVVPNGVLKTSAWHGPRHRTVGPVLPNIYQPLSVQKIREHAYSGTHIKKKKKTRPRQTQDQCVLS